MTEYVNKERLKQAVRDKWKDLETRVEVNCIVNEMPTIDIPEAPHFETEAEGIAYLVGAFSVALDIVHCGECKYYEDEYCTRWGDGYYDDFFCANGEGRTE